MRDIDASTAVRNFRNMLDEAQAGESFAITRFGRPVAALIPWPEVAAPEKDAQAIVTPAPAVAVDLHGFPTTPDKAARTLPASAEWTPERVAAVDQAKAAQQARDELLRGFKK